MKLNPNMTARERNYAIQPGGAGSPSAYVFRDIAKTLFPLGKVFP